VEAGRSIGLIDEITAARSRHDREREQQDGADLFPRLERWIVLGWVGGRGIPRGSTSSGVSTC